MPKVIIVGSGMAGVAAAHHLAQDPTFQVVLVEAQNRAGGRMHKHTFTPNLISASQRAEMGDPHVTVQLGANWIHGLVAEKNPLFAIAQKLKLELFQTSSDDEPGDDVLLFDLQQKHPTPAVDSDESTSASEHGACELPHAVPASVYRCVLERYEWMRERVVGIVHERMAPAGGVDAPPAHTLRVDLQTALLQALEDSQADPALGACSDLERRCLFWCFDRLAIDIADPPRLQNALTWINSEDDGEGGEALVVGGYYQESNAQLQDVFEHLLAETLATGRVEGPLYKHAVTDIHYDSSSAMRVVCANGAELTGDRVLVTVPLGVMQAGTLRFHPPLPEAHRQALSPECLRMGLMNLVVLWYQHAFWPSSFNFLGVARAADEPTRFSTFLAPKMLDQQGRRAPILLCQVVDRFAEELECRSEADVAAEATHVLRTLFADSGVEVPDAIGCEFSRWRANPYARGSWTLILPGAPRPFQLNSDLAQDLDGRVFFGGEHTHPDYKGTVHGAYWSGVREAERVAVSLGAAPRPLPPAAQPTAVQTMLSSSAQVQDSQASEQQTQTSSSASVTAAAPAASSSSPVSTSPSAPSTSVSSSSSSPSLNVVSKPCSLCPASWSWRQWLLGAAAVGAAVGVSVLLGKSRQSSSASVKSQQQ